MASCSFHFKFSQSSVCSSNAGATYSSSTIWSKICIFFIEIMSVLAAFFTFVAGTNRRTVFCIINSSGNCSKMFWVYAPSIFADMVNNKSMRDFSIVKRENDSVGKKLVFINPGAPISSRIWPISPNPTRAGFFDSISNKSFDVHSCQAIYNICLYWQGKVS